MSALSPEQALVLTAIDRFLADPDLLVDDEGHDAGDVIEGIRQALTLVLPAQEIEGAITSLLARHGSSLDEDTQLVLEALLQAIERDDTEPSLEVLLAGEAELLQSNALDGTSLLVWEEGAMPPLAELEILELLERFPCRGEGARWNCDEFVQLLETKANLLEQTLLAVEVLEEEPHTLPKARTLVLAVPDDPEEPLDLLEVVVPLTVLQSGPGEDDPAGTPTDSSAADG
ncbi:MAG: hypothetical protein ACOVNL_04700 [Prochlorococcaceae cyanobacterium]|jgi:hypothetical protein